MQKKKLALFENDRYSVSIVDGYFLRRNLPSILIKDFLCFLSFKGFCFMVSARKIDIRMTFGFLAAYLTVLVGYILD